jgi:RNA polymerase sigma factor (sigma-70 family)
VADLLDRLRERPENRELWAKLYALLYSPVFYTVFKLSRGNTALARDITQEVFLRFYQRRTFKRTRDLSKATAYLRQAARHLLWDHLHSREIPTEDAKLSRLVEEQWRTAFDMEDELQLQQDIAQLADELSEEERELLSALLRAEPLRAMAKRLNISYSATAVRLHRLRHKISQLFS